MATLPGVPRATKAPCKAVRWKPGILEDGLGVPAFDKSFDDHFELNSEVIKAALEGTFHECCASFPEKKRQPEARGSSEPRV